jgi:hypothetical protein
MHFLYGRFKITVIEKECLLSILTECQPVESLIIFSRVVQKKLLVQVVLKCILTNKKLRGHSPQANYTDRATAACRRS